MLTVRPATLADAAALADLSRAAILRSAAGHYPEPALRAWAARRTVAAHEAMLTRGLGFVVTEDRILGFATLIVVRGEVDQLFTHPDAGGRGVARRLLSTVEDAARAAGLTGLVTHASHRAAPVFARAGFVAEATETVRLDDQELTRTRMRTRFIN